MLQHYNLEKGANRNVRVKATAEAQVMDPAASEAVAPTAGSGLKKQPKVRKAAKDLTPDEWKKESEKRAGRRAAMRNRQNAA
jgi:hypothetical protein